MLSAHFDGKQSRDPVDLPSTFHPSPSPTTFAFRSREVKRLMLDLDSYGGTDSLGMFPLFLKKTAEVLAPRLAAVFRRLLHLRSFPFCWRVTNFTPIPKGPPSSSAKGPPSSSPISLTPILSKVFERLVSVLWNAEVCFQPPSSLIGKVLALVMPFFVWHKPYRVLWRWGRRLE